MLDGRVGVGQHHVLGDSPGAAYGNTGAAPGAHRYGGRHGGGVDGGAEHPQPAAVFLYEVGGAVFRHQYPLFALGGLRQPDISVQRFPEHGELGFQRNQERRIAGLVNRGLVRILGIRVVVVLGGGVIQCPDGKAGQVEQLFAPGRSGDGYPAGSGGHVVGIGQVGGHGVADFVERKSHADRDGDAGSAGGANRDGGRSDKGRDARRVVRSQRDVRGGDSRDTIAVDEGLDIHLDPVLHAGARSAQTHAGTAGGGHGHRAGEHESVDLLLGDGGVLEAALRVHAGVQNVGLDRGGVGGQADQLPLVRFGVVLGPQVVGFFFSGGGFRPFKVFLPHILVDVAGADPVEDHDRFSRLDAGRVLIGGVVIGGGVVGIPADKVAGQGHPHGCGYPGAAAGG